MKKKKKRGGNRHHHRQQASSLTVLAPRASTFNSFKVAPVPAESVSCVTIYPANPGYAFYSPVASGTKIAECAVVPSDWDGTLYLSGTNGNLLVLSGMDVLVGPDGITLPPGTVGAVTYHFTVSASP